jgi:2-polyprenyl-3-methyl-5-hydroxy-6-metoxy-1,4-benzoquinol methylase
MLAADRMNLLRNGAAKLISAICSSHLLLVTRPAVKYIFSRRHVYPNAWRGTQSGGGTKYHMAAIPTDAVDFYSDVAASFHESYKADANRQERVEVWRGFLDRYATQAKTGFDIGCGSGIFGCELARRGIDTIGIDGARNMLAIAQRSAREQGLGNITFQQHRLPIADTSEFDPADIIISSSAIEYLDSMPDALGFLRRLLKPGGVVIFSVSNRDSLSRKAVRLVHSVSGRPAYFGLLKQFMTVGDIQSDLRSAGLTYLEHAYFARADRINRLLGSFLPQRLASNMIIVAARRDI